MPIYYSIMFIAVGFALGYVLARLRADRAALDLTRTNARLESELNAEKTALADVKKQMSDHFEALSAKVAKESQQSFLTLAEESFKRLQESSKADHDKRETAIKGLVDPVHKNLEVLSKTVNEMEKNRHGSFTELAQNIALIRDDHEKLRSATSSLAQALRSPTARGKWGEIHLRRAIEAVGMMESVDFVQQDMLKTDDSFQKPDVVINLPGKRSIVIDAKAPIDAFLDATKDGISEDERKRALARHAEQVRKHIKVLGSRGYWEKLESPEFVLMYLPGDAYYAAALEVDPTLFEAGIENKVFLMTPTTLFPTLRVIEHAWKQEKLAQNAKDISALGQDLYRRLCTFGSHLEKIGKGLGTAIASYDSAIGSLERNVLPAARKFRDMQSMSESDKLPTPEPLNQQPRRLQSPDIDTAEEDAA